MLRTENLAANANSVCRIVRRTVCVLSLVVLTASTALAQARPAGASDPIAMVAYVGFARYGMFDAIDTCHSPQCELFRRMSLLFDRNDLVEIGKAFGFVNEVWTVNAGMPGSQVGGPHGRAPWRTRIFIGNGLKNWDNSLFVLLSGDSPQRVTMLRLSGVTVGGKPHAEVLYDSISKPIPIGDSDTPLGGVESVTVQGDELLLQEAAVLGSRDTHTGRRIMVKATPSGLALRVALARR